MPGLEKEEDVFQCICRALMIDQVLRRGTRDDQHRPFCSYESISSDNRTANRISQEANNRGTLHFLNTS